MRRFGHHIRDFIFLGICLTLFSSCISRIGIQAMEGRADRVIQMIDTEGVDPNSSSALHVDWSPLMWAAQSKSPQTVKALLDRHADVNFQCKKDGYTALLVGLTSLLNSNSKKTEEIVTLLINAGANVNVSTKESGYSPLFIAVLTRANISLVKPLLDNGADVNHIIKKNSTSLHFAVRDNSIEHVKILLDYGADKTIRNNEGLTPLEIAQQKGFKDIGKILK